MKPTTLLKLMLIPSLVLALIFIGCQKEKRECSGVIEKEFSLTGFTRINAGESFTINIVRGNNYSIKANGCANEIADLDLSVGNGQVLNIKYKKYVYDRNKVSFTITLPSLAGTIISGAANVNISGFEGQSSVIRNVLSGAARCTLNGTGIVTQIDLSGASELTITGTTENLYGNMSGSTRLFAYGLPSIEVDIATSGTAKAYVMPQQKLFVSASGASYVYYKGNPSTKNFETTGTSKVIQE